MKEPRKFEILGVDWIEDNETLRNYLREIKMKKDRYFRATFMDAANMDYQITVEFKAPFPIDGKLDYAKVAQVKFNHLISLGHIKVRDIEPVEV